MLSLTPNQATIYGALGGAALGGIIGGIVSLLTTRYLVKHGPNYEEKIGSIHATLASLANTQGQLKEYHARAFEEEEKHRAAEIERAEAAKWKPNARILAVNEGHEHVNKLSIDSAEKFVLREVFLLSDGGTRIFKFPQIWTQPVIGQNIPIPHSALNDLAAKSESYGLAGSFEGAIQYTVERVTGSSTTYTGVVKFQATNTQLGNTRWFHLVG